MVTLTGDHASGLGFGAHLNEDSRGMARAVSTRSLIATHLRSGFLRFERAHKPQRERGKKFRGHSIAPSHRPSSMLIVMSLALALALTFYQSGRLEALFRDTTYFDSFLATHFLSVKRGDILRANQEAGFGN